MARVVRMKMEEVVVWIHSKSLVLRQIWGKEVKARTVSGVLLM